MASSRRSKSARVRRTPPTPAPTIEQVDRIMAAANAEPRLHNTRDAFVILAETGLRASELRDLKVANIDVLGSRLLVSGKKSKARSIPLTGRALNALQNLHSHFLGSDLVLGAKACGVLHRVSLTLCKITAQLGNDGHRLHSFRRFHVARQLEGGVDPMHSRI